MLVYACLALVTAAPNRASELGAAVDRGAGALWRPQSVCYPHTYALAHDISSRRPRPHRVASCTSTHSNQCLAVASGLFSRARHLLYVVRDRADSPRLALPSESDGRHNADAAVGSTPYPGTQMLYELAAASFHNHFHLTVWKPPCWIDRNGACMALD